QVHGNVWEWVEDCGHDNYNGAPADGSAWVSGVCIGRILRGGSWGSTPLNLRSTNRSRSNTDGRDYYVGFRVARTLD
ncbi:MAG TPA: formylglycine-generating enzyme family protein, partial [Rhodomicrobium sp.]|nr:formylglycine-generating enzyme family protein [Rhodomicrobium sp.]